MVTANVVDLFSLRIENVCVYVCVPVLVCVCVCKERNTTFGNYCKDLIWTLPDTHVQTQSIIYSVSLHTHLTHT